MKWCGKEQVKYKCSLKMDVRDASSGDILKTINRENLLTNEGRYTILSAAANHGLETLYGNAERVYIGTSSTPATVTDNLSSFGTYTYLSFVNVGITPTHELVITWQAGISIFNQRTIYSVGIGTNKAKLINRVVLSQDDAVNKTSNIIVDGSWTILFS